MYTSGCPKNQKRCWKRIGSPPLQGVKKFVPNKRSQSNIVMAPANTGSDNNNRYVVTIIDHGYRGAATRPVPRDFMLNSVTRKLIAPAMLLRPAICKLKIAISTAGPL